MGTTGFYRDELHEYMAAAVRSRGAGTLGGRGEALALGRWEGTRESWILSYLLRTQYSIITLLKTLWHRTMKSLS